MAVQARWWVVQEEGWRRRQTIVGWVYTVFGIIGIVWGVVIPLVDDGETSLALPLILGLLGFLHIVGGIGLALGRRWSRAIMWPICALYLTASPMGVLVGGYGLWVLYNTRESAEPLRKPVFIAGCAGAAFLILTGISYDNFGRDPSGFDDQVLAAIEAQGGTEEFQQWLATLRNESDQGSAIIALTQRGLLRLSPDDQLTHTQFASYAMDQASIADCASYTRGTGTARNHRMVTERLDSLWVKQGADVKARAILAEIRGFPPAQPAPQNDMVDYIAMVHDSLSAADRRRFEVVSESLATVSDRDACWFGRMLLTRALEQPASRARWVRAVATLSLGPQ